MWLASLCATNQALHDAYLNLGQKNATLNQEIKVPMNETFRFRIYLQNRAKDSSTADVQKDWKDILCPTGASDGIAKVTADGEMENAVFSMTLELKTLQGQQISKTTYSPTCPRPSSEEGRILSLGTVDIKKGKYIVSITSEKPISIPNSQNPLVLLSGTSAGFP